MQNKFDGWVPINQNGILFYEREVAGNRETSWDPFPGWVLKYDQNGVLVAVHSTTNKKVFSFRDLEVQNLIINQEAIRRLREQKDAAERVALHAQYRTNPALLVDHEYEPDVNPFPATGATGMDVRLRRQQRSGKIIWVPGGEIAWTDYLRNPGFDTWGQERPSMSIITRGRDGLNLMHTNEFFGKYELVCGIMNVADICVFLPDMLSDDVAATLKIAIDEASCAYTAAHAKVNYRPSGEIDSAYAAADRKAKAAANIEKPGWVQARPYQTFAYLDFMYNRGTRDELTYFVPSSQGDDLQELTAKGYRRIKMLNGEDYYPHPIARAIIITMVIKGTRIRYRTEEGNEVLMSCTPHEREIYYRPRQQPGAAVAESRPSPSRGCWSFCRKNSRIAPSVEGGRNRNKCRNRKQRTIKKHKNNKHNKHNKHKKRSIQQQSTR